MLSSRNLGELVEALITGAVEQPGWSRFLELLRTACQADYASLVFRPQPFGLRKNRVIHLHSGRSSPPLVSQLYRDSLHLTDPVAYMELTDGRVYRPSELLPAPEHQDHFRKIIAASGMTVMRMMRAVESSGLSAWLTVSRDNIEFDRSVDRLITNLAPFLRAALSNHIAIERERVAASIANEALERISFGWLSLDGAGRVIDAHTCSSSLLERAGLVLCGRERRLTSTEVKVATQISLAIEAAARPGRARPRAVVLSREPWVNMLLVASNVAATAMAPAPALLAYIHADNWSSADRCEQLSQLLNLSRSEARLSLALSRGLSLSEAAGELGIAVESARSYSKKIYCKTRTRGQTELVCLIHRSVLPFA